MIVLKNSLLKNNKNLIKKELKVFTKKNILKN